MARPDRCTRSSPARPGPDARVITDAWQGYRGLEALGYAHQRRSQRAARAGGGDPGKLLPAVHRVASLAKRWLLGTHQGSIDPAHLPSYLDEFVFRFNRRRSSSRGMVFYRVLELAARHDPVRFQDLLPARNRGQRRTREAGATRRAWNAPRRIGHEEPANSSCSYPSTPVK
jgi:hypothetical protein